MRRKGCPLQAEVTHSGLMLLLNVYWNINKRSSYAKLNIAEQPVNILLREGLDQESDSHSSLWLFALFMSCLFIFYLFIPTPEIQPHLLSLTSTSPLRRVLRPGPVDSTEVEMPFLLYWPKEETYLCVCLSLISSLIYPDREMRSLTYLWQNLS